MNLKQLAVACAAALALPAAHAAAPANAFDTSGALVVYFTGGSDSDGFDPVMLYMLYGPAYK